MYPPHQIQQLHLGLLTVPETYYKLMGLCISFSSKNVKSREYMLHGFLRRLGTLQRCIENVYSVYPIERSDIPSRNECIDLTINLQSFVFNVFGCIDNLAWIWAFENRLTTEAGGQLERRDISFHRRTFKRTLPLEFQKYLDDLKGWFKYMEGFRHALAHRIPLYIPPYTVSPVNIDKHEELERRKNLAAQRRDFDDYEKLDAEQTSLGRFTPAMTHSHSEGSAFVYFHGQVLADWNTVAEIAERFLAQLNSAHTASLR